MKQYKSMISVSAGCLLTVTGAGFAGPYASTVVSFEAGSGGAVGYDDPTVALGPPERFTGEGVFPSVVSLASSPFGTDEIVSIGSGGHLTVAFDEPVLDDPANPFGVDPMTIRDIEVWGTVLEGRVRPAPRD